MKISDELYGEYELKDQVLIDLIQSKELQRLKEIHMAGPAYLLNPVWNETRYEHSIGVMLLIKKLGGSLEEQIAGLLHDVSHTAFSHLIDFVLDKKEENFHEEIKLDFISKSSIPNI
ncbi:HD domain-containing protein [Enterococcus sp. BWB1-3]|uniref:HD domain-containing protein n=1 Tax=Enterococcus sp. BWB1-3 TaxID=2787713 RepID=UPI001F24C277|nr:HD domain-containing protein [Enterococcus sp. BWB1-3]